MKKYLNDLKLQFKEQIRVAGKIELMPRQESKRRSFKDIDITKDFENRLHEKKKQDQINLMKKEMIDYSNMSLAQLEEYREHETEKEEQEKQSDLYNKILLNATQKQNVQIIIKTHQIFDRHFEEMKLHPQVRKNLETIDYQMRYNLPLEKKLLFEAVPELFRYEIGNLEEEERLKYNHRRYSIETSDGVLTKAEQIEESLINQTYAEDKVNEMKLYVMFQRQDFAIKYDGFLQQALDWGWGTRADYLDSLYKKDANKLTSVEELMLKELKELDHIDEEIALLERANNMKEPELILPFPMEGRFKDEFISLVKHNWKYYTVNVLDTIIVPYLIPEETFMDRLRKIPGVDIDEEIRISNEKYLKTINSGLPIRAKNLNAKDPEMLRQINIISQAVQKLNPWGELIQGSKEIPLDCIEEQMMGQLPTEGRILVEEYFRVLYLNNEDPEKYNFAYWEKYFNVSRVTLRNIFNYVFFPMPNEKNPTEIGKVLYFQDAEYIQRRKMLSEMNSEEYQEYLSQTKDRPELQELKRLEYVDFQLAANEPRITDRTVPTDDFEIDDKLDAPLIHSDIIKEIDKKISEMSKNYLENANIQQIDRDVFLKIEELKQKRIEFEEKKNRELEKNQEKRYTVEELEKMKIQQNENDQNNEIKQIKENK